MIAWMLIASVAVIAVIAIAAVIRSNNNDKQILRHTVEVNLGILKQELEAVSPLADSLTGSDKTEADRLIAHCREVVAEIEPALCHASHSKLGYFLTRVFRAMDSSSELHRLLIKNGLLKPGSQVDWHLE